MGGFWIDAGAFLLRWLHVVAAIAWIGESFYFVALDRGLRRPKLPLPTRQVSTGSAIPA